VDQRIKPLLLAKLNTRLLTRLEEVRDTSGEALLLKLGCHLYELVFGRSAPPEIEDTIRMLAHSSQRLHGVDIRTFVKKMASLLEGLLES
jgi:hypothetical protein